MAASTGQNLHILFFPFPAQGHLLPMIDMAKLFAARSATITILTIPSSSSLILPAINHFNSSATSPILLHLLHSEISLLNFPKDLTFLTQSFDRILKQLRPDCVVSDFFLPWTNQVAAMNNTPRISFVGTSFFALCCVNSFEQHHQTPKGDTFILPALPHRIEMLWSQIRDPGKVPPSMAPLMEVIQQAKDIDSKNYGMVANSFYDLEPDYVEHYRKVLKKKAWHIGPVSLCNEEQDDKLSRGGGSRGGEECLKWLDGREEREVVYLCFGSRSNFTAAQLREMAVGLEDSGYPFLWAVAENAGEEWIPEGYRERMEGKGVIVSGWVPQLLILNHAAVGGFVTHCGWNSSLEGIMAGLPMGTWPMCAEQFFNERFLVDVVRIGVEVGSKVYVMGKEEVPVVEAEKLEAAVRRLMGEGEEAEGRRRRAEEMKEMGRKAVEEGGSSYNDVGKLMEELKERKAGLLNL